MVSVCMATYNGEKYIKEQLDSILAQLSDTDELVISDDGSKDNTIEIIKKMNDSRIVLLHNGVRDYTKNFENALRHAKGDVIFLSDQDDVWVENKVKKTLEEFKRTGADLLVSNVYAVDKNRNVMIEDFFEYCNVKRGFLNNWLKTRYIGACMAFKREMLEKILPIPGKSKYIDHVYWIACVGELYYKTMLIKEPLIYYRRHDNNTSTGGLGKSNLNIFERIYKRFYVLKYLKDVR